MVSLPLTFKGTVAWDGFHPEGKNIIQSFLRETAYLLPRQIRAVVFDFQIVETLFR